MRLFITAKTKQLAFEVVEYDPAAHRAVLRGINGIVVDHNFHLYMVRRVYDLVHEAPEFFRSDS